MEIKLKKITIREVCEGYGNDAEEGVVGYHGKLNIRPAYQREFVYKDKKRDEVIRSIMRGLPLNVFYWCKTGEDTYEVLDGQQRTISFCEYITGNYSVDDKFFHSLTSDMKQKILNYDLLVYECEGTNSEKLEWFKIVNIAGEPLNDQELRNAVYSGAWVSDARRYFSKSNGAAKKIGGDYLAGDSLRQEYLEKAIKWAASVDGVSVEQYMSQHQHDASAVQLWNYFRSVIDWIQAVFPKYRKEMKGLEWGIFYNEHSERTDLDPKALELEVQRLYGDPDVSSKKGVYEYLLTGNVNKLSIRGFDDRDKQVAYEKQEHKCAVCGKEFEYKAMHGDHIIPWSKGGHTTPDNLQMLCRDCNLRKGAQE